MENFLEFRKIYSPEQETLISQEFCRLNEECYLDHAGSTLYSEKQIQGVFSDLSKNIYANPHAKNLASRLTEDAIDIIRYRILDHFNTNIEEYSVVFTSGTTDALKIIGECFNYEDDGTLAYLENNHTSVLGMRNYAKNLVEIKTEVALRLLSSTSTVTDCELDTEESYFNNSLFVYPTQCNFSGTKYPLTWIENIRNGILNSLSPKKTKNWYVALDCASYVSTNKLDLSKHKPDFVTISFYKMFGYPTGLGALLVRKSSEHLLIKKYFGGGTVLMALSSRNVMIPRIHLHERFEDGTLPFLSILAVNHGFDIIKNLSLNFDIISQHTFSLAQYVYRNLLTLHHSNGKPAVILYHDTIFENREEQGGIVNFNLLRANGDYIGYSEVLHIANLHGIYLRTGCFCNPGACQRFLKLSPRDVMRHFDAGHVCGDEQDLVDNYPTGSIRISFGYMSTEADAKKFLNMIESCFVLNPVKRKLPSKWADMRKHYEELFSPFKRTHKLIRLNEVSPFDSHDSYNKCISHNSRNEEQLEHKIGRLEQILLYPIKSCGAFATAEDWTLTSTGLKYDRNWMIVNQTGTCLTQKHNKNLCLIKPEIDLRRDVLKISYKDTSNIEISLKCPSYMENPLNPFQSKVCGDCVKGWDCGDDIAEWLSTSLGIPGLRLLQQCDSNEEFLGRVPRKDTTPRLSLANKAQYLLINSSSVKWLKQKIPDNDLNEDINSIIARFRPNFVVNLLEAFEENNFDAFRFDDIVFKSAGVCTRCQMICINQNTGAITKEPLLTLSREFKGKISFGVYLNQHISDEMNISVGSNIIGMKRNTD